MTLQKELQINIVINNYMGRSSSYSSNYDYIFLDTLTSCSYSSLFRDDLKNLKIRTGDNSECGVLYLPSYGSQQACILVRVPVSEISESTKLILEVHDRSTIFSSTLSTGGEVLMFDANSDTYLDFFRDHPGLSINYDSTDGGKFLRAKYNFSPDMSSPRSLITKVASGSSLSNNRVTVARFKRIGGCVDVNDNAIYYGTSTGTYMMQVDYNLTSYEEDLKITSIFWGGEKPYLMFDGAKTLVQVNSNDAYESGSDDEGDYKKYHFHGRVSDGFSSDSDYLEGFSRNNSAKIYATTYNEVEIIPNWYETTDFEDFNYVDLKWLLIFPSPLFGANAIPTITLTEKQSKTGIRLYKGEHEYPKAYRGSTLLWDANDETMENTGLYLPDKIINKNWDWVF